MILDASTISFPAPYRKTFRKPLLRASTQLGVVCIKLQKQVLSTFPSRAKNFHAGKKLGYKARAN